MQYITQQKVVIVTVPKRWFVKDYTLQILTPTTSTELSAVADITEHGSAVPTAFDSFLTPLPPPHTRVDNRKQSSKGQSALAMHDVRCFPCKPTHQQPLDVRQLIRRQRCPKSRADTRQTFLFDLLIWHMTTSWLDNYYHLWCMSGGAMWGCWGQWASHLSEELADSP